jgi:hypothetical protein
MVNHPTRTFAKAGIRTSPIPKWSPRKKKKIERWKIIVLVDTSLDYLLCTHYINLWISIQFVGVWGGIMSAILTRREHKSIRLSTKCFSSFHYGME